ARLSFGRNHSTVPSHDPVGRCQPDAGAFEIRGAVQPFERAEDLVDELHFETDAVIPDEVAPIATMLLASEFDPGNRGFLAELEGILQNVLEQHPDKRTIAMLMQPAGDREDYVAVRSRSPQSIRDL